MASPADASVALACGRGHLPLRLPGHARVTTRRHSRPPVPKLSDIVAELNGVSMTDTLRGRGRHGSPSAADTEETGTSSANRGQRPA